MISLFFPCLFIWCPGGSPVSPVHKLWFDFFDWTRTVASFTSTFRPKIKCKIVRESRWKPGIRVVGKGSWKEREVGKSKMKLERLKLESSSRSLKVRGEVGKFELKLESSGWNWKVQLKVLAEVPSSILAFQLHKSLSNCGETFQLQRNFQTSNETFQHWSVLSNFACFFATSLASFQLKQKLSNFRLSKLKLSNFSFFSNCSFQLHVSRKSVPWALVGVIRRTFNNWSIEFLFGNFSFCLVFKSDESESFRATLIKNNFNIRNGSKFLKVQFRKLNRQLNRF